MVHAGLYGFTGQYSGVEVDPTQITITDGGIQPQLYGGTLYDPTVGSLALRWNLANWLDACGRL